ncbi:MAG TPA: hypothetical protein VFB21_12765 [Chthonomonadaceae bacterium]|nr:hypothetical protein [Chthonomonadaceae bacterium]
MPRERRAGSPVSAAEDASGMTITALLREQVRQRANFACEYCGVTETDTASLLTIDHYRC